MKNSPVPQDYLDPFKALRSKAKNLLEKWQTEDVTRTRSESDEFLEKLKLYYIQLDLLNDDLQRTKTELAAAHNRCALFYDQAPAACLLLTEDGIIMEANPRGRELLGASDHGIQIERQPLADFLSPGGRVDFARQLAQVMREDQPRQCLWQLERPAPATLRLLCRKARDAAGKWFCLALVMESLAGGELADESSQNAEAAGVAFFSPHSNQALLWLDKKLTILGGEGSAQITAFLQNGPLPLIEVLRIPLFEEVEQALPHLLESKNSLCLPPGANPADSWGKILCLPAHSRPDYQLLLLLADVAAALSPAVNLAGAEAKKQLSFF